ncbi:MAG: sodium:calcium antiporter [Candidatus Dormibacteria bacterium]
MTTALLFLLSGALLVVAAELFTNAIEWAGYSLHLGSGATGSLLAAIGTSLPETIVPVIALATRAPSADSVAIGAVLGSSLLLMTLATAAMGATVALRRSTPSLVLSPRQVHQDLGVFVGGYSAALVCIVLPFPARIVVGVALLVTYAWHVRQTLRQSAPDEEMPEPLHIIRWRRSEPRPHPLFIALQLVIAVAMLVIASELFVTALHSVATALGVPALILAIIVVPLATELPEALNSVLWVRTNDDGLAFGNIAGSAAFQATVLAFIGLVFTSWRPTFGAIVGALLALGSGAVLLGVLWRGRARGALLMLAAVPWVAYVIAQGVTGGHLGA